MKSLIAALWFNRLAAERGLALVGVSRGVDPDAEVPADVAAQLRQDGFDLEGVAPVSLQTDDLTTAVHVIAIGASSPLFKGLRSQPEKWDDIPPATVDYRAARDAIRLRLESLLKVLAGTPSAGQRP